MNVQLSQTVIVGLVVLCAAVLRALGAIDTTSCVSVLVGGLAWAGGHAGGVAQGRAAAVEALHIPRPPEAPQ